MDELTLTLRIGFAALLAGLLGIEREWKGQSAGFRTHILVAVGSCLFTLVGTYAFLPDPSTPPQALSVDPTRVPSQIIVGIGFLGGGAILKYGLHVRGLTTAANLWLAAAVGMAVGVGYYYAAIFCVLLSLAALAGLRPIERKLFGKVQEADQPDADHLNRGDANGMRPRNPNANDNTRNGSVTDRARPGDARPLQEH